MCGGAARLRGGNHHSQRPRPGRRGYAQWHRQCNAYCLLMLSFKMGNITRKDLRLAGAGMHNDTDNAVHLLTKCCLLKWDMSFAKICDWLEQICTIAQTTHIMQHPDVIHVAVASSVVCAAPEQGCNVALRYISNITFPTKQKPCTINVCSTTNCQFNSHASTMPLKWGIIIDARCCRC